MKETIVAFVSMTIFASIFATALVCELDRPILYLDNETHQCVAWSEADQEGINPCLDEWGHWLDGAEHVWVDGEAFMEERNAK